jgi:hypothetical protein
MNPISAYGVSIAGIQAINGRIGASPRPRPKDSDEGSDKDNGEGADTEADTPQPQPQPPGVGRLVDKSA